ncbi:MAG: hypothetical protein BWY45_02403 [Euryarchaeota archaeon ADurb.Bin294]|nr:MAG: hypothetical protein BWY45_02403 [Euryarchaeota archaeon ADurb.Bin294]
MRATTACSMATAEHIPSASAWCRSRIGWAVKTARRICFAIFLISGRSRSRTGLSINMGISAGSARSSIACSIRSSTSFASAPCRTSSRASSTWTWPPRIITSPVARTVSPWFTSGNARLPASINPAAFSVPLSSTRVKMVGPEVCLIWATWHSSVTVLPTFFPKSSSFVVRRLHTTG